LFLGFSAWAFFAAAGCGSADAEPVAPATTDTGSLDVGFDTAPEATVVDTAVPHVPKAPRCVPSDAGGDGASDPSDAASDASTDSASDSGVVSFPPMQAIDAGGRVLRHPHVVPITFDGDGNRDDLEDFAASFGCTSYWRAIGEEYGVHEATGGAPIHVAEAPPAKTTDKGIETWLRGKLVGKTEGWEQPTPETIYAVYYSSDTVVKLGTLESCNGFGGFHKSFTMPDGSDVSYAVMMDCSGSIDDLTSVSSHELIEASTDPVPYGAPAYSGADDDHAAYWFRTGGEVSDLCETQDRGGQYSPSDYPFVVQRSWSNRAALAGHDPCVPAAGDVYFNVVPELSDSVSMITSSGAVDTKGVKMAVGESKTIYLDLFSDGAIAPWKLAVKDASYEAPHLSFSLDKSTAGSGERVALTITKKSESDAIGAEPFMIVSSSGGRRTYAYGVVGH
jgi:hypothetical protein